MFFYFSYKNCVVIINYWRTTTVISERPVVNNICHKGFPLPPISQLLSFSFRDVSNDFHNLIRPYPNSPPTTESH